MPIIESYLSPDGRLRFLVVADASGDLALGFDGYTWHTHGDILAELSGEPEAEAVRRYVDDLLGDRSVIAIWGTEPGRSVGDRLGDPSIIALWGMKSGIQDVWISDDPVRDLNDPLEGETIELRYWSGRPWVAS